MASFSLDVQKFAESFIGGSEQAIRGTAIAFDAALIDSSPVDTGRFRANWFVTGVEPSQEITTSFDKSGAKTKSRNQSKIRSATDWSTFTFTNNLPYSEVIEFGGYGDGPNTTGGYSNQAPQGVIRINVAGFNSLLEAQAKRHLPK